MRFICAPFCSLHDCSSRAGTRVRFRKSTSLPKPEMGKGPQHASKAKDWTNSKTDVSHGPWTFCKIRFPMVYVIRVGPELTQAAWNYTATLYKRSQIYATFKLLLSAHTGLRSKRKIPKGKTNSEVEFEAWSGETRDFLRGVIPIPTSSGGYIWIHF